MSLLPGTVLIGGVRSVTVRPDGNEVAAVTASNVTGHDLQGGQRVMLTFDDPAGIFVTGIIGGVGGWTGYIPTLGGTGWALGNGSFERAEYAVDEIGMVELWVVVLFGSTSTFGSASPSVTIPFDIHANWSFAPALFGRMRISAVNYPAVAFVINNNTVRWDRMTANAASVAAAVTTSTTPDVWSSGDRLLVNGRYRRA